MNLQMRDQKNIEKGIKQEKLDVAKKMLAENYPEDAVLKITGLDAEALKRLKCEMEKSIQKYGLPERLKSYPVYLNGAMTNRGWNI